MVRARTPPDFESSPGHLDAIGALTTTSTSTQGDVWQPTPPDWLYGKWYMTHTSQAYYHERTTNLTIQYAPVLNGTWPCANQELVTLTPRVDPKRIYTAFGIDTPIPGLDDAWLGKYASYAASELTIGSW